MEPRVAVYRARNNESGQAKFGHIWLKPHTKVFETLASKKLIDTSKETLDGIWTIDWREPTSEYTNIFGDDLEPELDYAKGMRERMLKPKAKAGGSKQALKKKIVEALDNWTHNTGAVPACSTGNCGIIKGGNGYVDKGIEPMSAAPSATGYVPPYTIVYAPAENA